MEATENKNKSEKIHLNDKRVLNYTVVPNIAADVMELHDHESSNDDLFHQSIIIDGEEILIQQILDENTGFVYLEDLQDYLSNYGYSIEPPLL